jgi:hypothetical protein
MYPKIEFTMTCGRRKDLFMETFESFLRCCLDQDLITRWIISDDGSTPEDLLDIKLEYPFLEIYSNKFNSQAANLNFLFNQVRTEWFFHCEDDWLFLKEDHFIRKMFDVASTDSRIRNVVLRGWNGPFIKVGNVEYRMHVYHPNGALALVEFNDWRWFGYSLNPGLQHLPTVKEIGKYPVDTTGLPHPRYFDRPPAIAYSLLGYKRANLLEPYISHIGQGRSVYEG